MPCGRESEEQARTPRLGRSALGKSEKQQASPRRTIGRSLNEIVPIPHDTWINSASLPASRISLSTRRAVSLP